MTKALLETLQFNICQAYHSYSTSEDICNDGSRSLLTVRFKTISLFHFLALKPHKELWSGVDDEGIQLPATTRP